MRKKLKNKIIALAILTSIIIIAVVFISKSKTQNTKVDENNKFFNAEKGDLPVLIVQTGQLKASQSYKIKAPIIPGISRDLKLEWIVSEGSKVKKDEVIAKLDREPIQQDIDNLTAELESEKALLSIEKENFKIQESQNILNLNTAKINLENSGNELKKYNTLELPTQINEFEVKTNAAKIKYEEAQKNLKNLQQQAESQLFVESSQEADTKKKVEDAKKIVENAKTLLESTELEYKIFKRYTSPEQLGNKMTAYEKAKMDLERTKVTSGSSIIQIQERIRQKERTIKDKETKSKKSKEYLEQLILKALVDGLVIYKDVDLPYWRASTDEMKEGKIVRPGEVIITIPDLSAYEVSVEIGEESISKLKEKMDGTIKIEAIPDLILISNQE